MSTLPSNPGPLLERERELERVTDLLSSAYDGTGAALMISGPPGIGKTSLLDACARVAAARGVLSLRARGDGLGMESSFSAVRELLWSHAREADEHVWSGAARLASPVFDDHSESRVDLDLTGSVLYGLYWLVAGLAERTPLAFLIDDAQWLDAASGRFLVYLARRIEALPLLLVVVMRGRQLPDPDSPLAALVEVAAGELRVGPLSEEASATLVRSWLGPRADDELCRSCHAATGGNPYYLRELTAALADEPGRPTLETARRVRELGSGTIGRTVLVRVARLGADCERLAQAVAVLGPACALRQAAALSGLGHDRAATAADALRAGDLLTADRPLSFVHPIVSDALRAELPRSRRAALHLEAAGLLAADGAGADRVAAHLLSAEPSGQAWVVDTLRSAARQALARGAPEVAVSCLRRALDEPPAPESRLAVLVELGRAEMRLPGALDFTSLHEALALTGDAHTRAEISLELALGLFGVMQIAPARAVLQHALQYSEHLDAGTVERLEAALIGGGLDELGETPGLLSRAAPYFERMTRGEVRDPRTLSVLSQIAAVTGRPASEVASLAQLALADARLRDRWLDNGYTPATWALGASDRLLDAARCADAGIVEAQRRGVAPMFMQLAAIRAEIALRAGDLSTSEAYAERAVELGRELCTNHVALLQSLPVVLAERGSAQAASRLFEGIEFDSSFLGDSYGVVLLAHRGRVRIAHGELELGFSDLLDADRRMAAAGWQLSVLTDWAPSAVPALVALGRESEARRLASRELADAIAFGAPRRHGIAVSLSGLLDPGDDGLARLHEGVAILARTPARLEHARALVNLGAGLRSRRDRAAARAALSQGREIAHRCGAGALSARARDELLASGARPRREALSGRDALTPAELRTAQMAAAGLTNREIAQSLFVSAKTVEAQLSQAYAKLSISGRRELARALQD